MLDLADAASPEVTDCAPKTLLVPLGSLEQHGRHLPLSTDTLIASHVAAELTRALPHCALAPAIPLGASGEHAGFTGTLSIGTEALMALIVELSRDADRDYERVILVNGHGGNASAITSAQAICRFESRALDVAHCHFAGADADAHAGRTETSILLHIAPHLVRLALAERGNTESVAALLPSMRSGGVRAVSRNGVLGDPTGASAHEGAQLISALVRDLVARFQ